MDAYNVTRGQTIKHEGRTLAVTGYPEILGDKVLIPVVDWSLTEMDEGQCFRSAMNFCVSVNRGTQVELLA